MGMSEMITKTTTMLICIVLLSSILPVIGATTNNHCETTDSAFGWTITRGIIENIKKEGNDLYFRAIRLHYIEITGMQISIGIIKLRRCKISDLGPDRQLTLGPFGSFTWLFSINQGGITELD
jgi:hypothetical protein